MKRLMILISGGGSNMQAVIDACESAKLNAEVVAVVSSNANALGIERAAKKGVDTYVFINKEDRDRKILAIAKEKNVDYIVLAGYLGIITPLLIDAYKNKIINIHPSLLPKHGGKGMYGIKVHESVINSGDSISGATVHFVNEGIDEGSIILQRETDVLDGDSLEDLQKRVLEIEHELLIEALQKIL
ncbi:MAG: phosphoribosylglycinamide formyltransferase [Firmicutes bacterium]|nr:phosphoribosylglycinamide formyltransferase [Bacillota bacterium]